MVPVGVVQVGCVVTDAVGDTKAGFTVTITFFEIGQPVAVLLVTV
jgi:hypothetical protein